MWHFEERTDAAISCCRFYAHGSSYTRDVEDAVPYGEGASHDCRARHP
ncbi:MAG: hypothetical protein PUF80_02085 [Firmicutes bacterium]|nr:hypothetical protein [Bacillota bacterium]